MKFFTSAVLASVASAAMTAEDIGEIATGILYEIGVDSSLNDLTNCMSDSYIIEQDLTDAIDNFEHFRFEKGVNDLINAANKFPEAFHGCTHMFDDLSAIAEWTSIVAHPQELKQKIEKNSALHILKLKKDVTALMEELDDSEYFKAGETIGDILTIELGKVPSPKYDYSENMPVLEIYDIATLISGIIYGVSEDGNLKDLSECLVDADKIEMNAVIALNDLFSGDKQAALTELSIIASQLPDALGQCEEIKPDLKALEQWLSIVKDKPALKKRIEKNTAAHLIKVKKDIKNAKADIAAQEYFKAGEVIADLLLIELGPIPRPTDFSFLQ